MALGVQANASTQREWFCVAVEYRLKDRQHRIAANLRYSRLSLTTYLLSWIKQYTIYDRIDNVNMYLVI